MEIIIQSLGFKAGETLENFTREKIKGIKDDSIVGANVILYKGPASNPENDYCEIRLQIPGHDHFVKKHSQYFETSVSECVDILKQMIVKSKEKAGNRKVDKNSLQMDENFSDGTDNDQFDESLN